MREVLVGLGSCGLAAGGLKVYQKFAELLGSASDAVLKKTGCIGMCYAEVLVEVRDEKNGSTVYGNVSPDKVAKIVESHVRNGQAVTEWIVDTNGSTSKQQRIALRNCGVIDPDSLDEYLARDG